jgi:hypothetical protein
MQCDIPMITQEEILAHTRDGLKVTIIRGHSGQKRIVIGKDRAEGETAHLMEDAIQRPFV